MQSSLYRRKTIYAGALVLDASYPVPVRGDSLRARAGKRKLSSEAQQRLNRKYSYRKLELLLAANFTPGDWCCDLTYAPGCLPETRDQAAQILKRFRAILAAARKKKEGGSLRMVWTTENASGGGRWHHHVVVNACGDDIDTIRRCWRWGLVEMHPLVIDAENSYEALARYLCKEPRERAGLRSWSCTRGLRRPEVEISTITGTDLPAPPSGAVVYDSVERENQWGRFRVVRFLLPTLLRSACEDPGRPRRRRMRW